MQRVQRVAVVHRHAGQQLGAVVLVGLVGDDDQPGHAFGHQALHDLQHRMAFGPLTDLLAARHGDGVVVQNFVGDVHTCRYRLANRQQPAVKVGAVAQVGEHMRVGGERRLADPADAFAAHLRERAGRAVHPGGHVMAANAAHGAGTVGHPGAGVVRAAAAKPGGALAGVDLAAGQCALARGHHRQTLVHAARDVFRHPQLFQPLGNRLGDDGGRQVRLGTQQPVAAGVGLAPFAALPTTAGITFRLVKLAQHIGPHVGAPVVQLFLDLIFNDLALFLDHQNLLQSLGEVTRHGSLQRPHHIDLVQANAQLLAHRLVQPQIMQRLAGVVERLAAGDDAKAVAGRGNHVVIEFVGPDVGQRGIPFEVHEPRFLLQRRIRPADVQAAGRHHKVIGGDDPDAVGIDRHRTRRLDHFLNRLHARPHA